MKRKNELINTEHQKKANALYANQLLETANKEILLSLPKNNNLTHKDINGDPHLDRVKIVLSEKEYNLYVFKNFKIFNFFPGIQRVFSAFLGLILALTIQNVFNFNPFSDLSYLLIIKGLLLITPIVLFIEMRDIKRFLSFKKEKKRISNK